MAESICQSRVSDASLVSTVSYQTGGGRASSELPTEDEVEEEPLPEDSSTENQPQTARHFSGTLQTEPEAEEQEPNKNPGTSDVPMPQAIWEYPLTRADKHLRVKHLLDREMTARDFEMRQKLRRSIAEKESIQRAAETKIAKLWADNACLEEMYEEVQRSAEKTEKEKQAVLEHAEQLKDLLGKVADSAPLPAEAREAVQQILACPVPGAGAQTWLEDSKDLGGAASSSVDLEQSGPTQEGTFTQLVKNAYYVLDQFTPGEVTPMRRAPRDAQELQLALRHEPETVVNRAKDVIVDLWDCMFGDGEE